MNDQKSKKFGQIRKQAEQNHGFVCQQSLSLSLSSGTRNDMETMRTRFADLNGKPIIRKP